MVERETRAMRELKGMTVTQAGFGILGLGVIFGDPGMHTWQDEEAWVNKKLGFFKKL